MAGLKNDADASELISRSLVGGLSSVDQASVEEYLAGSEAGQSYANLSARIQSSASQAAQSTGEASEMGKQFRLSDVAKERLKRSVRKALLDSFSETPASLVAERETIYYGGGESQRATEGREAVARFNLLHRIGQGGLGSVWLARDEVLKRQVAVKEMSDEAAKNPRLVNRFRREAEITAHLEHPNVVPLYMSGENPETGLPFYAMRFLGKRTLGRRDQGISCAAGRKRQRHARSASLAKRVLGCLPSHRVCSFARRRPSRLEARQYRLR